LDKKIKHKEEKLSAVQLNQAIDITSGEDTNKEEKAILKGIINFGNTEVKQIMKPRMDVVSVDIDSNFKELLHIVRENGYSRMPVYKDNFDHTEGVLYIKDILPFLEEDETYNWKRLIKQPFFVPETKKIDDLLKEFQEKRVHFAVVVDEYGGKSGIVTLEDILEEIFGEINDEFDVDNILYTKINDNTYSVDAKMLIIDFCKLVEMEEDYFDSIKGDSETLGGLVLELAGKIPNKNQKLNYEIFEFTVEAADKRRIKTLKIEKKTT
jgi:gliding motility-associated protein GldE